MKIKILMPVLFIATFAVFTQAQHVIKIDNMSADLSRQFETVLNNGPSNENFWIGYSILRNDEHQIMIGSYFFDDENNVVSLRDIITNNTKFRNYNSHRGTTKRRRIFGRSIRINNGVSIGNGTDTDKETAILFKYHKNSQSVNNFTEIAICNLSLYFDLYNCPLIWLGRKDNKNSLDFLLNLYKKTKDNFSKKELIPSVGIHTDQPAVTSFLIDIINSDTENELRKDVVFWLGFQNNNEAFAALKNIISSDHSLDIRKNAVMSLSYIKVPGATDELINVAKHNSNNELRKHAVYGLGNKAIKHAEDALKGIVENDPDIEIKKHAVYALANTSNNIVPYLIKIAQTHPSFSIRKCAIWSLGNSDDKRAIDALIALAKKSK